MRLCLNDIVLTGGRYGLGSKDTPPSSILLCSRAGVMISRRSCHTCITDDVSHLSCPRRSRSSPLPSPQPLAFKECKFWGLAGDGTVGANKNSVKIIGDHTDKYVQAYFQYDSKKTGATISHLRFGDKAHPQPPTISTRADFRGPTPLTSTWA